jgi:hypothetical protein
VSYEEKNQYRIYHLVQEKVHITRNVRIDEKNIYKKNSKDDFTDDWWTNEDDENFWLELNDDSTDTSFEKKKRLISRLIKSISIRFIIEVRISSKSSSRSHQDSMRIKADIASADKRNRDTVIFEANANAEKFFEITDNIAIEEKYLSNDSTEIRASRRSTRTNKSKASIKFEANFLVNDIESEYFFYTKAVINCLITEHDINDSKSLREARKYFDWEKFEKAIKFEHDSLVENEI